MSKLSPFFRFLGVVGGVASLLTCAAILCGTSGCAVGPDYQPPETAAPPAFAAASGQDVPGVAENVATSAPLPEETAAAWWKLFGDPRLDSLMDRAAQGSPDLRVAQARLRQARALRSQAVSGFLPEGGPQGSYQRVKSVELFSSSAPGSVAGTGTQGASALSQSRESDLWQASFDASWEIDVFGGVRRGVEAASAELAASRASLADALVSLRAEVGRNYVEARGFQRRLAIARRNVETRTESVQVNEARFNSGLVSELDLARARGELESALAVIPALDAQYRASVHRLGVLLGLEPAALMGEMDQDMAEARIPAIPEVLPAGLPSELLRRRPDVRQAESAIHAATARIGVAEADLFPRFSLTGQFGYQAQDLDNLTHDRNNFWSVGPTLNWNILNLKRIQSGIDAASAERDAALAGYERTVLLAFEETENAIVQLSREKVRAKNLGNSVAANERALEIARSRYVGGIESYLAVIDAEAAVYSAWDQQAQSLQNQALGLVALYKALGGGWREGEPALAGSPGEAKDVAAGEAGTASRP